MQNFLIGVVVGVLLAGVVSRLISFVNILLPWRRAMMSGAPVSLVSILGMRLRGSPVMFLVDARCALTQANTPVDIRIIESCYIANRHRLADGDMSEFLKMVQAFDPPTR